MHLLFLFALLIQVAKEILITLLTANFTPQMEVAKPLEFETLPKGVE